MSAPSKSLSIDAPAGLPFMELTREFDHPPAAVYRAYADPAIVVRWYAPTGREMRIDEWDVRDGGAYRYAHTGDDGFAVRLRGVFHTAREAELIVQTFEFEFAPDQVAIDAWSFEDLPGGRSRIRIRSVFPSVEARDEALRSGMSEGLDQMYRALDELLMRG